LFFEISIDSVYATLQYAMNTESINGVKGKGNFKPPKADDQENLGLLKRK